MHCLKKLLSCNCFPRPISCGGKISSKIVKQARHINHKKQILQQTFSNSVSVFSEQVSSFWRLWNIALFTQTTQDAKEENLSFKNEWNAGFKTHLLQDTTSGTADVSVVSFSTYPCHMSTYLQDLKPMTEDSSVKAAQQWNDLQLFVLKQYGCHMTYRHTNSLGLGRVQVLRISTHHSSFQRTLTVFSSNPSWWRNHFGDPLPLFILISSQTYKPLTLTLAFSLRKFWQQLVWL